MSLVTPLDQIRRTRQLIQRISGIYFLFRGDDLVYIGQSINVLGRVTAHTSDKDFDSFAYLPCPEKELLAVEALYINEFKPLLNGRANRNLVSDLKTMYELKKLWDRGEHFHGQLCLI